MFYEGTCTDLQSIVHQCFSSSITLSSSSTNPTKGSLPGIVLLYAILTSQAATMLYLHGLLFNPEDRGSTFLQSIGNVHQTLRRQIPQDSYHCRNLKFHVYLPYSTVPLSDTTTYVSVLENDTIGSGHGSF